MLNTLMNIVLWIAIVILLFIVVYWILFPLIINSHLNGIHDQLKAKQKTDEQILKELVRIRKACEGKNKDN